MRRFTFASTVLLIVAIAIDSTLLTLAAGSRASHLHHRIDPRSRLPTDYKRASIPPTLLAATNATESTIEAFLDVSTLPNPWPLSILSVLFSLATGISRYKFNLPELTWRTKVGWGITIVRSLGLGISAILNMKKGNYNGVSSDGFPVLFSNVLGVVGAGRDYGEVLWALGGMVSMAFGILPRLIQLCIAVWKPNTKNWLAPYKWSNGTECIVDLSAKCQVTIDSEYNLKYCPAPIYQVDGKESIHTPVDYVRAFAWLFVLLLCIGGLIYLYKKSENAKMLSRNWQVIISYIALGFSLALVFASAIIYAKGGRLEALDCRTVTTCQKGQPLPCPNITVLLPRSPNGFFKQWAKQLSPADIPALLT